MPALKEISIPTWIFDHPGEYFMIGIEPNGDVRVDGSHTNPQDVAKAKHLHESILAIAPPRGTKFVMIKVENVSEFNGEVNDDAICILNKRIVRKDRLVAEIGDRE